MDLDELQRVFFDGLYTNRFAVAVAAGLVVLVLAVVARRLGWFAAARRHPGRLGAVVVAALVIGLPLTWYVASPLWIRTELVEPGPVAEVDPTPPALAAPGAAGPSVRAPDRTQLPPAAPTAPPPITAPEPTPFEVRTFASGPFHGTDDFHFGRGTASIIETAAGTYHLRLEDFSVRNGPDLFVYLSPDPADYAKGALELGRLKATDGAFGYDLPVGTDPADFASAIVWCKQFSHLFAVAPLSVA